MRDNVYNFIDDIIRIWYYVNVEVLNSPFRIHYVIPDDLTIEMYRNVMTRKEHKYGAI